MKLFFSLFFFLLIAILNLFFTQQDGWVVFALAILLFFLFIKKIWHESNYKKVILLLFFLFTTNLNLFFFTFPISSEPFSPHLQKDTFQVVENFAKGTIVKNAHNKKIYLQKNSWATKTQDRFDLDDTFQAEIWIHEKITTQKDKFSMFLKSKKVFFKAFWKKVNYSTITKSQTLRSKLIQFFRSSKIGIVKNWSLYLIFQITENSFLPKKENLRNLGVAHFFVVSGFHLLLVGSFWFWLARKQKNSLLKIFFLFWGFLFCVFLTYLTNWKISAVKALLLLFISFASQHFLRIKFWPKNEIISFIGLLFLLFNPLIFYNLSFQLSFLASWTISFFLCLKRKKTKKITNFFVVNWFVWVILIPVFINLTYRLNFFVPFLLLICNLIVYFFYPFFIIGIWIPKLNFVFRIFFTTLENLLQTFDQPSFYLPFGKLSSIKIFFYYLIIICTLLSFFVFQHVYPAFFLTLFALFLFFLFNWFSMPFYHFHMIDVNHGLAMFLQSPDRRTNILFDAGSGNFPENNSKVISQFLKSHQVTELDAVFISHADNDHRNNLVHLTKHFVIKRIITNENQSHFYQVNELNIENLAFFYYKTMKKDNNKSFVFQFEIENWKFLLPFDAEAKAEKKLLSLNLLKKADFLQVAHHGSMTSSTINFLKKINPKYCLVSSNKKLPKEEKFLCEVYNTYEVGSVDIFLKNQPIIKFPKQK